MIHKASFTYRAEVCPARALRLPFGALSGQLAPLGRNLIPATEEASQPCQPRQPCQPCQILLYNCTPMREGDTACSAGGELVILGNSFTNFCFNRLTGSRLATVVLVLVLVSLG